MTAPLLARLDGTLSDPAAPFLRADDLGVVRGDGVFDVALAIDGVVRELDDHLARLAASAALLDLPTPDETGYRRAAHSLLTAWDWSAAPEATLRFVLTRGPEGGGDPSAWVAITELSASSIRERHDGVRVVVLDRGFEGEGIVDLPWLLPGAKSLSYGINMAAKRYALAHGAQDALFVAPSGRLLEGPTSTLLLERDGALHTPVQDGILESITLAELVRRAPETGLAVEFTELDREDLASADGAWLLSSGRIVAAITAVDGVPVPLGSLDGALRRALNVPARP